MERNQPANPDPDGNPSIKQPDISSEPQTLSREQLQRAREEASMQAFAERNPESVREERKAAGEGGSGLKLSA